MILNEFGFKNSVGDPLVIQACFKTTKHSGMIMVKIGDDIVRSGALADFTNNPLKVNFKVEGNKLEAEIGVNL